MDSMKFSENGIVLTYEFFQTMKDYFLSSRDTFDKLVYDILNTYLDEINKNNVYIQLPQVEKHERAQFHLFARANLEIYSIGESVKGYGYRTLIIQPKARYINSLIKKYKSPHPVIDISTEINLFKNLVIQDMEQIIEEHVQSLISKLTI